MRDSTGQILYIGKAKDLAKRVSQYFISPRSETAATPTLHGPRSSAEGAGKIGILVPLIRKIDYIPCENEKEALLLEQRLIRNQQPFFNCMWKDDKSYPYIRLSIQEDFPRLEITRQHPMQSFGYRRSPQKGDPIRQHPSHDKALYFGPYPNITPIRQLLRYLWKKRFFPLRPCRWNFSIKNPLDPKKIRSCLYYHTQECPAPCAGKISPRNYRKIAQRAALFFQGRYDTLKTAFAKEMRQASHRLDYEQAAQVRDRTRALEYLGERVTLEELQGERWIRKLEGSRAVTSLQSVLALQKPPLHIEAFDISHLFGKEPVGSMVCFKGGIPFKEHYRKFKIEMPYKWGGDDYQMLREVISRRYKRLLREGEFLPDLVLIDGGKGQLHTAEEVFQGLKLSIPLAALAKREEKVFLPANTLRRASSTGGPLRKGAPSASPAACEIPSDSPALHLLQHIRDEAHRFGVTYHRLRRKKKLFSS
ncbi:MAG: excinuclease ABC subunit UvrC [Elusimicrobia bacterium]|nr:excinuclease ABC subunit UvrC [Elusimicrobiota bacterium]